MIVETLSFLILCLRLLHLSDNLKFWYFVVNFILKVSRAFLTNVFQSGWFETRKMHCFWEWVEARNLLLSSLFWACCECASYSVPQITSGQIRLQEVRNKGQSYSLPADLHWFGGGGGGGKLHQRFWNHMWYKQTRVVSFSFSCVLGLSVSLVSSFRCAVSLLPQDNLHVCQNHKTLTFSGFPLWAGSCCLWARCQVRSIFRNETSVYSSLERSQKYIQECHL